MNWAVFATNDRFLEDEQIKTADIAILQKELDLFQSVRNGLTLLFAQCALAECTLAVSESELNLLLEMLDTRIENALSRQQETETMGQFDGIVSLYQDERERYVLYLKQFNVLYDSAIGQADEVPSVLEEEQVKELLEYEEALPDTEEPDAAWQEGQ